MFYAPIRWIARIPRVRQVFYGLVLDWPWQGLETARWHFWKIRMKSLGEKVAALETEIAAVEAERDELLKRLPNMPHASVPEGTSEADNVVVRTWGTPRVFDFPPRPHWDLGERLGILDFERAARMTGTRFALLSGDGALLERALINFMLDLHTKAHGYTEVLPPFLVNAQSLFAPEVRQLSRLYISRAKDITLDGAGRILLPPDTRKQAGLEKEVTILGGGRKMFEVWDRARFDEYERTQGDALPTLFEKLSALGV